DHARPPVYAPNGACATTQPLAASAGLNALRRGGNAVDAAVAAAVTLTVVQPGANDIGGDLFAIVWDGRRLHGLNASGRAPAALTREAVLAFGARPTFAHGGAQARAEVAVPPFGWPPVTVPGAPAGWRDLHARFGRLPIADLFADAIAYAERGYRGAPQVARGWRAAIERHATLRGPEFEEWGRVFAAGGPPAPGEWRRNPDAARALRLIAASGAEEFYHGEIARAIAEHSRRTGGFLTADDLANHTSTWVDPISVSYRGHEVWELPPNGQGIAALLALA